MTGNQSEAEMGEIGVQSFYLKFNFLREREVSKIQ